MEEEEEDKSDEVSNVSPRRYLNSPVSQSSASSISRSVSVEETTYRDQPQVFFDSYYFSSSQDPQGEGIASHPLHSGSEGDDFKESGQPPVPNHIHVRSNDRDYTSEEDDRDDGSRAHDQGDDGEERNGGSEAGEPDDDATADNWRYVQNQGKVYFEPALDKDTKEEEAPPDWEHYVGSDGSSYEMGMDGEEAEIIDALMEENKFQLHLKHSYAQRRFSGKSLLGVVLPECRTGCLHKVRKNGPICGNAPRVYERSGTVYVYCDTHWQLFLNKHAEAQRKHRSKKGMSGKKKQSKKKSGSRKNDDSDSYQDTTDDDEHSRMSSPKKTLRKRSKTKAGRKTKGSKSSGKNFRCRTRPRSTRTSRRKTHHCLPLRVAMDTNMVTRVVITLQMTTLSLSILSILIRKNITN